MTTHQPITSAPSKRCTRCGEVKPLDNFHNHRKEKDGKACWCKLCDSMVGRARRKANYHRVRRISRAWPTSLPNHPDRPGVVFKDSPVHEGIRVGDDGSIWSCRGIGGWHRDEYWRELKPRPNRKGYRYVSIAGPDGKFHSRLVHQLVLETFVGPRPPGMEARHVISNDPGDNRLVNLAWGTPPENTADKWRHGTMPAGSKQWNAKLKEEDIPIIRAMVRSGIRYDDVGLKFNVTKTTICSIIKKRTWSHVR
jgi:hypothetical protein